MNRCRVGDLVKVTLRDFIKSEPHVIVGAVLDVNPSLPQIHAEPQMEPGPIYEIRLLTTSGEIWESWVDQQDEVEVLEEK